MARLNVGTALQRQAQDTFDIREFWQILLLRRRIVFGLTAALFLITGSYCVVAPRRYRATGIVEVKKAGHNNLGLDTELGVAEAQDPDSLIVNIEIQTQAKILESDDAALKVVEELGLEGSPDFRPHFNPIAPLIALLTPSGHPDSANLPLSERPVRRDVILKTFAKNLKVEPTGGTRLIEVSYLSEDPKTSASVVNRLIQDLSATSLLGERGPGTGPQWMEDQLSQMRAESERLQDKVAKLQEKAGIVSLGTTDITGRDQTYSATLDQLQQIAATLGQAQTSKITKGAIYDVVKTGNPELISGLSGPLTAAASPAINTSLNMIQNLRVEQAAEKANLAQGEAKFGSGYPKLEESRMRIARYEQEIHDEADRIRERAKNDYRIAAEAERQAQLEYDRVKSQANAVNNSAMNLAIAREEAESSRKLYEDLLSRSKQAELLTGLKASDISVVEPALLPGKPARPLVLIFLAASIVLGLILGAGIALCFDLTDSRVITVASIAGEFGKAPIGVLPVPSAQDLTESGDSVSVPGLAAFKMPRTPYVEALQFLTTSIFTPRHNQAAPKVVLITSPSGAEDRTSVSANMAVLLAQQAKRVLLIDGALNKPKVHDAFQIANRTGLSTLLATTGANPMSEVRTLASLSELFVLPAGTTSSSSSSSGLLSSARLTELIAEYRKAFDVVIVESSPVLTTADSIILAGHADAVVLISKLGATRTQDLHDSIDKLDGLISPDNLDLVASDARGGKVRVYEEGSK